MFKINKKRKNNLTSKQSKMGPEGAFIFRDILHV